MLSQFQTLPLHHQEFAINAYEKYHSTPTSYEYMNKVVKIYLVPLCDALQW
jgi:hypothetical protein